MSVNYSNMIDHGYAAGEAVIRVLSLDVQVPEDFFGALMERALDRIPRLPFEVVYRAQDIFGHDYWNTLRNRQRWLAGKVLAHLVVAKELPLRFASCRYCTIKRYVRT